MLPRDRLEVVHAGAVFVPGWLGPEDHPWLQELIDDLQRFEGRPAREWHARASEPLRAACHPGKRRMATWVLERLGQKDQAHPPRQASELRHGVFTTAQRARDAGGAFDRERVLAEVAATLGLDPATLVQRLYGDLPEEQPIVLPQPRPDACALARATNLALAQSLVRSATRLSIQLGGQTRAVVRQICLHRLLCTVRPAQDGVMIDVSGPFALFRRTTLYGRALASLVPVLRGADRFVLSARVTLGRRELTVRIASGDPVFPPSMAPVRRYDSRLEERFAKDFARRAPDWDLVREPEPVEVDGTWIFPDFALVHRRDIGRRWLLEIVGFWTPQYLSAKLDRLRRAGRSDVIVCVDAELACAEAPLPDDLRLLTFRKTVDAAAVLRILESQPLPRRAPQRLGLRELFVDFAGWFAADDPIHGRLARLQTGAAVQVVARGTHVFVEAEGGPVAALSSAAKVSWRAPPDTACPGRVLTLLERTADQTPSAWQARLRIDRWRVPVVDLQHEPA